MLLPPLVFPVAVIVAKAAVLIAVYGWLLDDLIVACSSLLAVIALIVLLDITRCIICPYSSRSLKTPQNSEITDISRLCSTEIRPHLLDSLVVTPPYTSPGSTSNVIGRFIEQVKRDRYINEENILSRRRGDIVDSAIKRPQPAISLALIGQDSLRKPSSYKLSFKNPMFKKPWQDLPKSQTPITVLAASSHCVGVSVRGLHFIIP